MLTSKLDLPSERSVPLPLTVAVEKATETISFLGKKIPVLNPAEAHTPPRRPAGTRFSVIDVAPSYVVRIERDENNHLTIPDGRFIKDDRPTVYGMVTVDENGEVNGLYNGMSRAGCMPGRRKGYNYELNQELGRPIVDGLQEAVDCYFFIWHYPSDVGTAEQCETCLNVSALSTFLRLFNVQLKANGDPTKEIASPFRTRLPRPVAESPLPRLRPRPIAGHDFVLWFGKKVPVVLAEGSSTIPSLPMGTKARIRNVTPLYVLEVERNVEGGKLVVPEGGYIRKDRHTLYSFLIADPKTHAVVALYIGITKEGRMLQRRWEYNHEFNQPNGRLVAQAVNRVGVKVYVTALHYPRTRESQERWEAALIADIKENHADIELLNDRPGHGEPVEVPSPRIERVSRTASASLADQIVPIRD